MPAAASSEEIQAARAAGLRHVSDAMPGYARRRHGKQFRYQDAAGHTLRDAQAIARIRALAIPPAWTEVWICPRADGHLQATGRDVRGRKQYRYHPDWRRIRDRGKFDRLAAFHAALPRLRRRVQHDLALPGLPRDKVLALLVQLLEQTLARVGNESYARDNHSFGLTTLRVRHLKRSAGGLTLEFNGKSGKAHALRIGDARLSRLLKRCHQLPGQHLFQYVDDAGGGQPVDSGMVNDYLATALAGAFTAKDFRTWGATRLAAAELAPITPPQPRDARSCALLQAEVVRTVAAELRNTPAVCRKSYIDPRVFDAWASGALARWSRACGSGPRRWERLLARVLGQRSSAAKRPVRSATRPRPRSARAASPRTAP